MQDANATNDLFGSWIALRDRFLNTQDNVQRCQMMSTNAVTFCGKVFAFYTTKGGRIGLGSHAGRETDLSQFNLRNWQIVAPFKCKPPMKDWIVIGSGDLPLGQKLSNIA